MCTPSIVIPTAYRECIAELRDDAKRLRDIVALFDDAPLSPQLETEIASLKNLSDLFEEAAEILVKKGTDYALQKHAGRL